VALTTVLNFPAGNASLRDTVVLLPVDVISNVAAVKRQCPSAIPLDACPARATIGSAEAASPLTATPLRGPLVLRENLTAGLPDLVVNLKGAAPLVLRGRPDFVGNRVRNTFPNAPDVPLSRFTLKVNGGKDGLLVAANDLCRPDKKQVLQATLKGWNGAVVTRKVALKPQGCKGYRPPKPEATVKLRRRSLSVSLIAGDYTKLRNVRLTLPKGVTVSRVRAKARKGALRSVKIKRRTVRVALSRTGAAKLRLSSRHLAVIRRLIGRRVRVKIAAKDSTGRTVRLTVKSRVRR
jgi:hypothetical protein